jgi:membrane-associated PAP2 superfamily phosphatase
VALNKQIFITLLALVTSIIFFALTNTDLYIQDMFFNKDTHMWILDSDLQPYRFIFYDGIKKFLIVVGVLFLIALVFFRKKDLIKRYQKGILVVVLSSILVPVIVGGLKKSTNMPCPKNEIHYGGRMIRTAVWETYQEPYKSMNKIACWPAGHASGGFALLSLIFLFKSKKMKTFALVLALGVGWSMGLYKMLVGDHFLSHTVITMILAYLIVLIVAKVVKVDN